MPALPGFDNLSGAIDATEKGGSFSLNSQQLVLQMPDYFAEASMPFDHLNLKARWSFEATTSCCSRSTAWTSSRRA
jgi:uncharacterized protein YhdP